VFECVVCGLCTRDALLYSVPHPRASVIAVCGLHCRRAFKKSWWKYLPDRAEHGGGF